MKRFHLLLSVKLSMYIVQANGQEYIEPQWKFYFAFEDATGAGDTIWLYLDSNITSWWPYEHSDFGIFPFTVPIDTFSVYTGYSQSEFGKIAVGNIEWPIDVHIHASNYTLPITLSWDTTLFNAPVLQATEAGPLCNPRLHSSYLENMTNADWLHNQYSMIFDTHVLLPEAPWLLQPHFPMTFYTDRGHNCDLLNVRTNSFIEIVVLYPNPCTEVLNLRSDAVIRNVEVYNLQGQLLLHQSLGLAVGAGAELRLDVRTLPPGMYLLKATAADGRAGVKKFLKSQ